MNVRYFSQILKTTFPNENLRTLFLESSFHYMVCRVSKYHCLCTSELDDNGDFDRIYLFDYYDYHQYQSKRHINELIYYIGHHVYVLGDRYDSELDKIKPILICMVKKARKIDKNKKNKISNFTTKMNTNTNTTDLLVKVINKSNNPLPNYQTIGSACMDICAFIEDANGILIKDGQIVKIPTGIYVEIPIGWEIAIRSRSGLASKYGIIVLNAPGTIDSDYRGEIIMIMINHSENDYLVKDGDRIGQLTVQKTTKIIWQDADELSETDRGEGGFGHTGK